MSTPFLKKFIYFEVSVLICLKSMLERRKLSICSFSSKLELEPDLDIYTGSSQNVPAPQHFLEQLEEQNIEGCRIRSILLCKLIFREE